MSQKAPHGFPWGAFVEKSVGQLVEVQVSSTGRSRGYGAEQRQAVGSNSADIITEGDIAAVAHDGKALIAGRVGCRPGSCRATQSQLGRAAGTSQIAAAACQLKAGAGTGQSPLIGSSRRSAAGNIAGQATQVKALCAHCRIGAILLSSQSIVAVATGIAAVSRNNDDIGACGKAGSTGDQIIGIRSGGSAAGRSTTGAGRRTAGGATAGRGTTDGQKLYIVVITGAGSAVRNCISTKARIGSVEDDTTGTAAGSGDTVSAVRAGRDVPLIGRSAAGEVATGRIGQILAAIIDGVRGTALSNRHNKAISIGSCNFAIGNLDFRSSNLACKAVRHCIVSAADLGCNDILACANRSATGRSATGARRALGVAAVLTGAAGICAACAGGIGATRAGNLMSAVTVAGILITVSQCGNGSSADYHTTSLAGNSSLAACSTGCIGGRAAGAAVSTSSAARGGATLTINRNGILTAGRRVASEDAAGGIVAHIFTGVGSLRHDGSIAAGNADGPLRIAVKRACLQLVSGTGGRAEIAIFTGIIESVVAAGLAKCEDLSRGSSSNRAAALGDVGLATVAGVLGGAHGIVIICRYDDDLIAVLQLAG